MGKYSPRRFFCFLWLIIVPLYSIGGTEFLMNAFAGDVTWDISSKYQKQFTPSFSIGRGSIIPYRFSLTASSEIKVINPSGSTSLVSISKIESNGFSRIFALKEVGEYKFEESYVLTINFPTLGESQTFKSKDVWSYGNSLPTLVEFQLQDMYIDNNTYNVLPSDTLDIYSITPPVARLGDTGEIKIITLRTIKSGEPISVSITSNSQWHKISSVKPLSTQRIIQLKPGWNLISFPTSICFYEGIPPSDQPDCVIPLNINDLEFDTLSEWFSSVIIPCKAWLMVIGVNGAMDSSLDPAFHSLKYMSPCSGYWVKIDEGFQNTVISMEASPFAPDCPIPLKEGWNLIGCPTGKAYHDANTQPTGIHVPDGTEWTQVNEPLAEYVFSSIAGKYDLIIGETGAYNPNLDVSFSSLRFVAPGYGYWIKMKQAESLVYPQD